MTNTRNTPVEALERAFPLRVWAYHLRDESGGAGKYRGGDGIRREYEALSDATVTVNAERRTVPPYGLAGGEPGLVGANAVIRREGETIPMEAKATARLAPGDRLIIDTPGGGGWGGGK